MSKSIKKIIALCLLTCMFTLMICPTPVYAEDVTVEEYQETDFSIINFLVGLSRTVLKRSSKNIETGEQEKYTKVPLFSQSDYPQYPYGKYGSIASHGCGIVSLSMVITYLTDELHHPIDMAAKYGHFNTEHGSYWSLFESTDQDFGVDVIAETYSWSKVKEALANGHVVIALQGKEGIFTDGGHYIVLTGLTEDGKILVNDPNGNNWNKNKEMIEGFLHGFTDEQVTKAGGPYWIYSLKGEVIEEDIITR